MPASCGPKQHITVWQPKPTRRIDWSPYDTCTRCNAQPGAPCLDQRISNRNTTGRPEARLPHKGRPRTFTAPPALDKSAAIVALLATAELAATVGVDVDPRDALHALGVTDKEIRAAQAASRQL